MIDRLPPGDVLRERLRALALLDGLLSPEWEYRWHSFDPAWGPGEAVGSMRDGSGDWYAVWFGVPGEALVRGFAHESVISPFRRDGTPWPGVLDGVPPQLAAFARDPSGFVAEEVTFCLWFTGGAWHRGPVRLPQGPDPDGSEALLALVCGGPADYVAFARSLFEVDLDVAVVEAIWGGEPLDREMSAAFGRATWKEAAQVAREVGYPIKPQGKPTGARRTPPPPAPAPPPPPAPGPDDDLGEASFTVEVGRGAVRMRVATRVVVEVPTRDPMLYDRVFDAVEALLKAEKKKKG